MEKCKKASGHVDTLETVIMKFKSILMIGFSPNDLRTEDWNKLDQLTEKKVLVAKDASEIPELLSVAECLLVKLGASVDKQMIDRGPKLKYIGMFGTGYGRIDASYAASKGIAVCNIAGYSTEAVAELVFALLLEQIREVERAKKQARDGNYSEATFQGTELRGKSFGIIGLGRIGRRVGEMALNGFGAEVSYWSRTRKADMEGKGLKYRDIETLLRSNDFLSLHLAYNDQTRNFLDDKRMKAIKKNAVIINLAPMELVNIAALQTRLGAGDITFILDHSDELDAENAKQLATYKNCVMYPPIGYTTKEATVAKQVMFVQNLESFLKGAPTNKVN
jgi:phosphoglycerate dehydrogenase-like enzyme